jgi:hypothetical protein
MGDIQDAEDFAAMLKNRYTDEELMAWPGTALKRSSEEQSWQCCSVLL